VDEWAASGSHSLKTDVDLTAGDAYLIKSGHTDLSGAATLTAKVAVASWGEPGAGLTAKLYVRVGDAMTWYDGGSTPVGVQGTTLRLDLSAIPDAGDVREFGVLFHPAADAGGTSAVYLDDVATTAPPQHYTGFESGIGPWQADGAASRPTTATDWKAEGTRSLAATVNLAAGEGRLFVRPAAPIVAGDHHTLRVTVRAATAGSRAKLYAKVVNSQLSPDDPSAEKWMDAGEFDISSSGSTLSLNIDLLPNGASPRITELGVYVQPPPGSSGSSVINLDDVELI
jgi:mannan endo-1,4-beta-mannosidase